MNSYATQNLETILEIAQSNGYSTGIVATSHLTHATPAAFMAHNSDRNNYRDIAEDISTADVDVLLGAGSGYSYLGRDISAMESKGYTYITNKTSLNATTSLPVLGLFTSSSLTPAYQRLESSPEPSLLEMTQKAIELLNNSGNPFFLMIEGSQIDWGAHENSRAYTGFETIEFEKSVKFAKELAENDPNLLLLVTADHETGGLSLGDYEFLTALPEESDDYTTRKSKRLARLNEISIYWSTSGHTNSEVILAGMGPNAEKILDAEHHTDTFSIMRKVIDGKTRPSLVNPQGLIYVGIFIGILSISAALTVIFIKLQQRKITV